MKNIAVFCASSSGYDPDFYEIAESLGSSLANSDITVIYGGAKIGLMGAVASGALKNGGKVIGVLPHFLDKREIAHGQLTQLIRVDTMHERKTHMNLLSDGVIALPGGFGTLEELFEMLTWGQLGLHDKPIGLLNCKGFYDPLVELTNKMVEGGFLSAANRDMLLVHDDINVLLTKMQQYTPSKTTKWVEEGKQ